MVILKTHRTCFLLLALSLYLGISGVLAASTTDRELEKYIEVLGEMRDDIVRGFRAATVKTPSPDESVEEKLKRIYDTQELMEAIDDIDNYIKELKVNGMPGAD